jgi:hypothetical protein
MVGIPDDLFRHLLGSLACGLVLCTFAMTSMRALRMVALASNVSFIGYAWMMGLWPILALHSILLPLNAVRLLQIEVQRRRVALAAFRLHPEAAFTKHT